MNYKAHIPLILVAAAIGLYFYRQNRAATVLDRRYPMAYTS
jgi:hypothetical protein